VQGWLQKELGHKKDLIGLLQHAAEVIDVHYWGNGQGNVIQRRHNFRASF